MNERLLEIVLESYMKCTHVSSRSIRVNCTDKAKTQHIEIPNPVKHQRYRMLYATKKIAILYHLNSLTSTHLRCSLMPCASLL